MSDDKKPKIVKLANVKPSKDAAPELEPDNSEYAYVVLDEIRKFIDTYGCTEIQVIMTERNECCLALGTDDRSPTMLGNMFQATSNYERELAEEAEYDE